MIEVKDNDVAGHEPAAHGAARSEGPVWLQRLGHAPVLGYLLRLGYAFVRLPVIVERQQQLIEQQQLIANLQAQAQTQMEQMQDALTELTAAITVQQQLTEALRHEQQIATDAHREFLIHEQRVIVETQKAVLEELREQLRELSEEQGHVRAALAAEVRRRQSQPDEARRSVDEKA
jgi:glucose/arabinose dehydrogenase